MIFVIDRVLDSHEAAALREAAARLDFEDGRRTAGRYAEGVKRNEQARDTPARAAVVDKVTQTLWANPLVQSVARPRRLVRALVSRYGPEMHYGAHVDDAVMAGHRTDLSFTLGLTPADDYEGGALVIEDPLERRAVRLDAGQMILYPSDTLHEVEPVGRGTRLAVVGWLQSWVRDPAQRMVLFDLDRTMRALDGIEVDPEARHRLLKARTNLMRMWADG